MFDNRADETRDVQMLSSADNDHSSSEMAERLALAETCPKFSGCNAAYCPALGPVFGGKHYEGDRVCSYLLESVKEGGQAHLRRYLPKELADPVINDGLRFRNSTGPLNKALKRASKQGSRMESMKRAAGFRRSGHD